MKKIYLSVLLMVCIVATKAQFNNSYGFTTTTASFTAITGTITPLTAAQSYNSANDEGYSNYIPLGFSFTYNGTAYTRVHANTNGFIALGDPFNSDDNENYYLNNLTSGPTLVTPASRPLIAPLWDDLAVGQISYTTTGTAPNRICTIEWLNVKWKYDATAASISFQVKLYETSNVIEFIYRQEAGTPGPSPSASIGLTALINGSGNFISLNGTGTSPNPSSTTETTTLNTRPATGQVYRFTPITCGMPTNITLTTLAQTNLVFQWPAINGATGYEYAVTTSSTPPVSGTAVNTTTGSTNSASPATLYYVHVRANCSGSYSNFRTKPFTTPCVSTSTGYYESFNNITPPNLPTCVLVEDVNNDGYTWITGASSGTDIPTKNIKYNWNPFAAADDWFYVGPFALVTGTNYTVSFNYKSSDGAPAVEKLEVKYGTQPLASWMLSSPIFSNTNIITKVTDPYTRGSGTFSVNSNGSYYIGFHVFSAANQAVLHLDDILFSGGTFPVALLNLKGEKAGNINQLTWTTSTESNNAGFEIERSADGKSFSKIAYVPTKAENGNSNSSINYDLNDEKPLSGTNYYRLKQLDQNGKYEYSTVVALKGDKPEFGISSIYPNPTKEQLNLIISSAKPDKISISITDIAGKVLKQLNTSVAMGENSLKLNVQSLATGTYYVRVISGEDARTTKFIKE